MAPPYFYTFLYAFALEAVHVPLWTALEAVHVPLQGADGPRGSTLGYTEGSIFEARVHILYILHIFTYF